jgi:1,4-dihydroxy-2-naphthoyl-CoA synthase
MQSCEVHKVCDETTYLMVIAYQLRIVQELGGNATMLFYQSEEGNEVNHKQIVLQLFFLL